MKSTFPSRICAYPGILVATMASLCVAFYPGCTTQPALDGLLPRTNGDDTDIVPVDSAAADLSSLQIFPDDNPWNQDISTLPVHPNSANYLASMALNTGLHPDFGTVWDGAPIGIPYVVVGGDQPRVPVSFDYANQSDPGPYPIPPDAPIEGGADSDGDRHIIVIDRDNRLLYELFYAYPSAGGWTAAPGRSSI